MRFSYVAFVWARQQSASRGGAGNRDHLDEEIFKGARWRVVLFSSWLSQFAAEFTIALEEREREGEE